MRPALQRRLERVVHLVAGVVLIAYVYLPLGDAVAHMVRWVVIPVLVGSGIAMWQAARIRRALKMRRARLMAQPGGRGPDQLDGPRRDRRRRVTRAPATTTRPAADTQATASPSTG